MVSNYQTPSNPSYCRHLWNSFVLHAASGAGVGFSIIPTCLTPHLVISALNGRDFSQESFSDESQQIKSTLFIATISFTALGAAFGGIYGIGKAHYDLYKNNSFKENLEMC